MPYYIVESFVLYTSPHLHRGLVRGLESCSENHRAQEHIGRGIEQGLREGVGTGLALLVRPREVVCLEDGVVFVAAGVSGWPSAARVTFYYASIHFILSVFRFLCAPETYQLVGRMYYLLIFSSCIFSLLVILLVLSVL